MWKNNGYLEETDGEAEAPFRPLRQENQSTGRDESVERERRRTDTALPVDGALLHFTAPRRRPAGPRSA
ncbi:unnamed protein product [Gadus morhua 'NCC']